MENENVLIQFTNWFNWNQTTQQQFSWIASHFDRFAHLNAQKRSQHAFFFIKFIAVFCLQISHLFRQMFKTMGWARHILLAVIEDMWAFSIEYHSDWCSISSNISTIIYCLLKICLIIRGFNFWNWATFLSYLQRNCLDSIIFLIKMYLCCHYIIIQQQQMYHLFWYKQPFQLCCIHSL